MIFSRPRFYFFVLMAVLCWNGRCLAYVTLDSEPIGTGAPTASAQVTVDIPAGLHFFALPGEPVQPWTASGLIAAVKKAGGDLVSLKHVNARGGFEPFGLSANFNLEAGRGYLVENKKECRVTVPIKSLRNTLTVNLRKGLNLLSVPKGGPYTASTLLADLQSKGAGSQYVLRVSGGTVDLYYPPLIVGDFPIENGKSYLITANKDMSWTAKVMSSQAVNAVSKTALQAQLEKAIAGRLALSGSGNTAPIMLPVEGKSLASGTVKGQLTAFDLDGDALRFSAQPMPKGFSLDPFTGSFGWNASQADAGSYSIAFRASDGSLTSTMTGNFDILKAGKPVSAAPPVLNGASKSSGLLQKSTP